jgi:hypothetical protein
MHGEKVRHGLTGLGRDPGFTAVVVSVLALGIGANVAMFGLLDAVMLKPLPFGIPIGSCAFGKRRDRASRMQPARLTSSTGATRRQQLKR